MATQIRNWFNQQICKYLQVQRIVRVKSWYPSIGPYGVEWPTMLVDRVGGQSYALNVVGLKSPQTRPW